MVARHRPGAGFSSALIWGWAALLPSGVAGCGGAQQEAQSAELEASSAEEEAPFDERSDAEASDTSDDDAAPDDAASNGRREKPQAKSSAKPVDITVTYARSKIESCGLVDEDGQKLCRGTDQSAHSGSATVLLVPIDAEQEVDSSRSEQTLEFADSPASQERTVALQPGFWELEWKGESTVRQRFRVAPGDRFEIALEGVAGMCAMDGAKCKLQGAKVQQSVELPEAREM